MTEFSLAVGGRRTEDGGRRTEGGGRRRADDGERKAEGGHYLAPGGVQLNRKYVELLRGSALKGMLRFRAKGANDPVLILDGKKVVGVMMPMKKT